ncbi:MAG TPA: hypothetical protein VND90_04305 [Terracidiphilus sp.]|nr:hypothetical protein [Terracidiphilus sp.]
MQTDPSRDWQSLSELYRGKSEGELCQLAEDYGDLTEVAQAVLRGEMKTRGLGDPAAPKRPERRPKRSAGTNDGEDADAEKDAAREYTWKTPLCACASMQQAKQIAEVLRRAEIESWIEGGVNPWDAGSLRVVVAADELDHARELLGGPVPQDVVEEASMETPVYVAPVCPACGAEDPVLQGVEPVNTWLCEACGKEWSEGAEGVAAGSEEGQS